VVFAPNHRSLLDPFAIAAVLPRAFLRQTFWGGATEWLFTNPFARLLSRIANVVPVDPRRAAISSLALGAAVLERRQNLVWFPEGGRSPTGELQRFLPGVGMLLERFKVPVVPMFIHGTEEALPLGRFLPRPARVTVVFGDPIHPDELARRGEGTETAERITNALHDAVAELGRRGAGAEPRRQAA
jgi:long-chain acyl-CoA synthetase